MQTRLPPPAACLFAAGVLAALAAWRLARRGRPAPPPAGPEAPKQAAARRQADLLAAREAWAQQRREQQAGSRARPVPVTLVTGDLGSGKTTLIRAILESVRDFSLGVIVNDFAALNVDHEAIERDAADIRGVPGALARPEVVELSNGCVCCSLSSGLADAVRAMLSATAETGVDYILIETSGLTDPAAIVRVVEQEIRGAVRLDAVVLMTDADRWQRTIRDTELRIADVVLLNKADLFPDEVAQRAALDAIRAAAGRARVMPTNFAAVALEHVLDVVRLEPEREAFGRIMQSKHARDRLGAYSIPDLGGNLQVRAPPSAGARHANDNVSVAAWSSFVFHADGPFSLPALQRLVLDDRAGMDRLARLKGTATFAEAPARVYDFQVSGSSRLSLVPRPSRRVTSARCDLAAVVHGPQTQADALRDALERATQASTPAPGSGASGGSCLATALADDPNWRLESGDLGSAVVRARLCGSRSFGMSPETLVRKFAIDLDAANLTFVKSLNASGASILALADVGPDTDALVTVVMANFAAGPDLERCLAAVGAATQTAFTVDFANVKHCRCD